MRNTITSLSQLDIANNRTVLVGLHQGCDNDLSADVLNFGAGDVPCLSKSASSFGVLKDAAATIFVGLGKGSDCVVNGTCKTKLKRS